MENHFFDLDKIKELTSSLENFQGKLIFFDEIPKEYEENKETLMNSVEEEQISIQIKEFSSIFYNLSEKLKNLVNQNAISFLQLKNELLHNYRQSFKENLKSLDLNQNLTKNIGLELIEKKKTSKIFKEPSFTSSIGISQWLDLTDALKENSLFLNLIDKISSFYREIVENRFNDELRKIPKNTNPTLIKEFEINFQKNPRLSFKQFLKEYDDERNDVDSKSKQEYIRKKRLRDELNQLKKTQEEQKEEYEDYFKLSEKEFDRRRRKKRREKLEDFKKEKKPIDEIEISDEVSEKIEKFKSQFEKRYERDYLIDQKEDVDPLKLIRERTSKKKKEFDEYKEHFNDV